MDLSQMNDMQREAVCHTDGPMMVLAGPGSGKTFVITNRLRYLVTEAGIDAGSILVITFTKAAATEMQERFTNLCGDEYAPVTFGTFHAIYFKILKETYNYDYSNIITEAEKRRYLRDILRALNNPMLDDTLIPRLLGDIGNVKNDGIAADEYNADYIDEGVFCDIFNAYSNRLKLENKIDFEDMVLNCLLLFKNNEEILNYWRSIYRYILIDEFQDINPMQYQVIRLLAEPLNNLFIVGDDDQSIYGFRGSCPDIMLNFTNEYPGADTVNLSYNYRSTVPIVSSATSFIAHNKKRYSKKLLAVKESNKNPVIWEFADKAEEYDTIVRIINTAARTSSYSDIALIFRTNKGAALLTQHLEKHKIPYHFKEKSVNLFEHHISEEILAMLAYSQGDYSRNTFLKFMNKPLRYISRSLLPGTVDLGELLRNDSFPDYVTPHVKKLIRDLETIRRLDLLSALTYIRKGMGYERFLYKDYKAHNRDTSEIDEVMEFLRAGFRGLGSYDELLEYIEDYNAGLNNADKDDDTDAVTIITMHSSKGLEYRTVFLPDLNEGNVPVRKATSQEAIEEERRVFYVAMTRAKENLYMCYVAKNKDNNNAPSRFLKEIPIEKLPWQ